MLNRARTRLLEAASLRACLSGRQILRFHIREVSQKTEFILEPYGGHEALLPLTLTLSLRERGPAPILPG